MTIIVFPIVNYSDANTCSLTFFRKKIKHKMSLPIVIRISEILSCDIIIIFGKVTFWIMVGTVRVKQSTNE